MQSKASKPLGRRVWAWSLYDFGNSSFAVLFGAMFAVYYTEDVVSPYYENVVGKPVEGEGDLWWGGTIALSMLLVAFSSPFMGGIADHTGRRKRILAFYTAVGVVSVFALMLVGPGGLGMVLVASALAALANIAFEGGLVFYNAYLPDIAPPDQRGRVSALGFAVGYAGSLVALGIAWPIVVSGHWQWMWAAIALQWLVFSLPLFKEMPPDQPTGLSLRAAALRGLKETGQTIRTVWGMKDLRRFLLAFFVYMDGVITVVYFASRYAKQTLEFTNLQVLGMLVIVQITALIGALAMGGPTDRKGPAWTVRVLLLWWVAVAVAAYLAQGQVFFLVVAGMAGLGLGSIQAASRVFLTRLTPKGRESEFFGFYALCGKTGSILGPITFGIVTMLSGGNQRPAVLAVAGFYFVGLLLLKGVKDDPVALADG